MSNLAIITGASSGIGRELARYHAAQGGDLWLVARRQPELEALKQELETAHAVTVTISAIDLADPEAPNTLYGQIKGADLSPSILMNNAGFGGHGQFIDRDLDADLGMIDLNVKTLVALCHLFGRDMAARGSGRILNVSSTASYMPGPLQATYFATKAFVSSFSQALDAELSGKGVTVTALEPGYVETSFSDRADLAGTDLVKNGASPENVAEFAYKAMLAGDLRAINDPKLRFMLNWIIPLMPRRSVLKMVQKMQQKAS